MLGYYVHIENSLSAWQISGQDFNVKMFILDEFDDIITPGCTSACLKALRQGYVIVTAGYQY